MYKFVVKQPIKTRDNVLAGNELLFNDENQLYSVNEDYSAAETLSTFLTLNSRKIDRSTLNFITFTPNLLFKSMPKMFQPDELVIQIEDNMTIHPLGQKILQKYRRAGFQVAINEFQFFPRYFRILEDADFIRVNMQKTSLHTMKNILSVCKGFEKKCIATNIDTKELYDLAKKFPFDFFQGPYVAEAGIIKAEKMHYIRSNFFQLVVAVTREVPDVDEIEKIIERDASLTYRLLRLVNSMHFSLRHRIVSVKQAVMVMGIEQLKRWVYLLSFSKDDDMDSATGSVLKASLLRANFCAELLSLAEDMPITKSEAYLMGMLSCMGMLVDAPMEEILQEVPLNDMIREALIFQKGKCALLLELLLCYERADWDETERYIEELGIPEELVAQTYLKCAAEVEKTWNELQMNQFKEELAAE